MITDARSQKGRTGPISIPNGRGGLRLRDRLAYVQQLAGNVYGSSITVDISRCKPISLTVQNGALVTRATQNVADWRTYLPESCVLVMISHGWDRST
jgi:hypothetical protein